MSNHIYSAALLASVLASACTFDLPADVSTGDDTASIQFTLISGGDQTGTAGSTLAEPIEVQAEDSNHQPISNLTIDFTVVAGGGTLSDATIRTDARGRARTTLTLGTLTGTNTVEAKSGLATPLMVSANGVAGPAARAVVVSGDATDGTVASTLSAPFVVRIEDGNANPVSNAEVTFVVTAGGGSVSPSNATTDGSGLAQTTLMLGTTAGAQTVEARVSGLDPVVFTATALASTAVEIRLVSGNLQRAVAGSALALPLVVRAFDVHGNAVPNTSVQFVVTGGNGTVSPGTASTDDSGTTQAALTTSTLAGANAVEARFASTTIAFSAIGDVGPPAAIVINAGNNQLGVLSTPLTAPFVVTVEDANHNAAPNTAITFVATLGGGTLSTTNTMTDAAGRAQTFLTMGAGSGFQQVEARVNAVPSAVFNATAVSYAESSVVPSVDSPTIAVGDLNADDRPDLVTGVFSDGRTVRVTLNNTPALATTPTYADPADFQAGFFATDQAFISIADMNGDGKPDLVVGMRLCVPCGATTHRVSVLLNTTTPLSMTPTFGPKVEFVVTGAPISMVTGDFNRDNKPDVAIALDTNGVAVLLNTTASLSTTPTLSTQQNFTTSTSTTTGSTRAMAVGDLNGDGRVDLAVGCQTSISVLINTTATLATTPTFASKVDVPAASSTITTGVSIGDFDGDGKPDLAGATSNTFVSVFRNTTPALATSPSFAARLDLTATTPVVAIEIVDVNGDGRIDLAAANRNGASVSMFLNKTAPATAPSFAAKVDLATGSQPLSIAAGDLNADGHRDLIVATAFEGVSVLFNR